MGKLTELVRSFLSPCQLFNPVSNVSAQNRCRNSVSLLIRQSRCVDPWVWRNSEWHQRGIKANRVFERASIRIRSNWPCFARAAAVNPCCRFFVPLRLFFYASHSTSTDFPAKADQPTLPLWLLRMIYYGFPSATVYRLRRRTARNGSGKLDYGTD